ncbi:hypothetical protein PTKIN_Ptkin01aG0110000 [Pterospermum kingtungense]
MGIIEGQADLDVQFDVSNEDHIDRLISCLLMALPFFVVRTAFDVTRGASGSEFLNYLNKHIIPVFDKKYMPRRKTAEETNFTYVECLLFSFHHLAHKAPNATNSLCDYKVVTGQPSDRLGEDFLEHYKDFTERLSSVEDLTRATMKKLSQGMAEHNKAMSAAKSDEAKDNIKTQKQNTMTGLRTCNNILAMTKPLHSTTPSFIGDRKCQPFLERSYKTFCAIQCKCNWGEATCYCS